MSLAKLLPIRKLSVVILTGGLLVVYILPDKWMFNRQSLCLCKMMLGFDCPGCGMTRAMHCFLHGQFITAMHYNPAIIPFMVLISVQCLADYIPATAYNILKRTTYLTFTITILSNYIFKTISICNQ